MTTVILIIHIIISISIVGLVLMQRSEGGGLGIGGGNNFMSARGTADLLTRATTILAIAFFCTSIILAMLAGYGKKSSSIIDEVSQFVKRIFIAFIVSIPIMTFGIALHTIEYIQVYLLFIGFNFIKLLPKSLCIEFSVCSLGSNPRFKFLFLKTVNGYSLGILQI